MLEGYEAYGDYHVHMALTEQLVAHLADGAAAARPRSPSTAARSTCRRRGGGPRWPSSPRPRWARTSASTRRSSALRELCDTHGVPWKDSYGTGKLLLELYEKTTEHTLWDPTFVIDYPTEVSPLSRDAPRANPGWSSASRRIVVGRELCNGFSELTDPTEQRDRFQDQAEQKAAGDDEAMVVDHDYLRSLDYGLPPTVGPGHRHGPAGAAADRHPHHPRRRAVPDAAARTGPLRAAARRWRGVRSR